MVEVRVGVRGRMRLAGQRGWRRVGRGGGRVGLSGGRRWRRRVLGRGFGGGGGVRVVVGGGRRGDYRRGPLGVISRVRVVGDG
jgi:hypothetical protein